jgi:N-acetylmuramoyl-L-alanine amidase CwlA
MTKITYTKRFLEEEVNPFHLREACHGHLEALLRAFDWEDTPQGNRHWSDQWCGLSPLDTEELQNMLDQYNSVIKEESADSSGEVCYDFDKMEVDRRYMDPFMTYDPVDKPAHYNQGGVECIDYIRQVLGLDGFIAYCHGNMIKYQHRYRYKQNPREDMKKAQWYLNKMNEALEEKYK